MQQKQYKITYLKLWSNGVKSTAIVSGTSKHNAVKKLKESDKDFAAVISIDILK